MSYKAELDARLENALMLSDTLLPVIGGASGCVQINILDSPTGDLSVFHVYSDGRLIDAGTRRLPSPDATITAPLSVFRNLGSNLRSWVNALQTGELSAAGDLHVLERLTPMLESEGWSAVASSAKGF